MRPKSFEKFYLTHVASGEGCGCAERVIDWRDIERAADENGRQLRPVKRRRKTALSERLKRLWPFS